MVNIIIYARRASKIVIVAVVANTFAYISESCTKKRRNVRPLAFFFVLAPH